MHLWDYLSCHSLWLRCILMWLKFNQTYGKCLKPTLSTICFIVFVKWTIVLHFFLSGALFNLLKCLHVYSYLFSWLYWNVISHVMHSLVWMWIFKDNVYVAFDMQFLKPRNVEWLISSDLRTIIMLTGSLFVSHLINCILPH